MLCFILLRLPRPLPRSWLLCLRLELNSCQSLHVSSLPTPTEAPIPNSLNKNTLLIWPQSPVLLRSSFAFSELWTLPSHTIKRPQAIRRQHLYYASSKVDIPRRKPARYAHVDVLRFTSTKPGNRCAPCSAPNPWHYFVSTANRDTSPETVVRKNKNRIIRLSKTLYLSALAFSS
jgi:hypothetical protein